ncbi:SpoIIAA family protein [Halorussus ruber]|uniref:STAS/SEC14 domain-containing protein n=1 Tax=Halorussus ruber TaxID=1126238 RepID=UPI00143CE082|nr:STAS/SEC14 domain-containing protein [Halorussus ruber]
MRITKIDGNIVYTELTTDASATDLEQSYERLMDIAEKHDKVHVYERVRLSGTDYLSMHTKASGDLKHGNRGDIGRVVAVGGGMWMKLFMALWKIPVWPLSPDKIRHLPPERAEEAEAWIKSGE